MKFTNLLMSKYIYDRKNIYIKSKNEIDEIIIIEKELINNNLLNPLKINNILKINLYLYDMIKFIIYINLIILTFSVLMYEENVIFSITALLYKITTDKYMVISLIALFFNTLIIKMLSNKYNSILNKIKNIKIDNFKLSTEKIIKLENFKIYEDFIKNKENLYGLWLFYVMNRHIEFNNEILLKNYYDKYYYENIESIEFK